MQKEKGLTFCMFWSVRLVCQVVSQNQPSVWLLTECLRWCVRCRNPWGLFLIWWHYSQSRPCRIFTSGGLSALCSLIFIFVYFLEGCSDLDWRRTVRWRWVSDNPWACLWKSLESKEGPSKKKSLEGDWTGILSVRSKGHIQIPSVPGSAHSLFLLCGQSTM